VPHISPTLCILDTPEALAHAAAQECTRLAIGSVASCGRFSMALAGGSTPKRLYSLLASERDEFRSAFPWMQTHFFWGDERHVPPDHPDSNYRMAHETMFSRVQVPLESIHRFQSEKAAVEAAADYERLLIRSLSPAQGQMPRFDLVLLGMGSDGHTASLFPETDVLGEQTRIAAEVWVPKFSSFRLTLTAPLLNNAQNVVFLVTGQDKAEALRAVLRGEFKPQQLPAQLIRPNRGQLRWLIDKAAARLL